MNSSEILLLILLLMSCKKQLPEDHLIIPLEQRIKTLDPIYASDEYTAVQIGLTYETLYQYDHTTENPVIIPLIAANIPQLYTTEWVIQLKKNIFFHDSPCFPNGKGRQLTAYDVVYSFQRLLDPQQNSSGFWIFEGKIKGLETWLKKPQQNALTYMPLAGLEPLDDFTLKIKLQEVSKEFIYKLAMPYTSIVPHEAVTYFKKNFGTQPVGTGPYILESFQPQHKIVWRKNPHFHEEYYPIQDTRFASRLPLNDKITVLIFSEPQTMWLNMLAQKIDFLKIPKDFYPSVFNTNHQLHPDLIKKGFSTFQMNSNDISYLAFNLDDPIVGKNLHLRQAIAKVYDKKKYLNFFNQQTSVIAQGPIPPSIPGFDAHFENIYQQYNPTAAKKLFFQPITLELASLSDSASRQQAEYLEYQLQDLQIQLNTTHYSWPEFLNVIRMRKAQLWYLTWTADYPNAENFYQLFYSKNVSPGPNDSGFQNPQYDRLYEASLKTIDQGLQKNLYQQMNKILAEQCPYIFISHNQRHYLLHSRLKHFKAKSFEHNFLKYLWVQN